MNVARSTLKIFLAEAVTSLVKSVGIFLFARILGPKLIGTFFLFHVVTRLLTVFGDFDVGRAVEKRLSEDGPDGGLLATAIALKIPILGVLATTLVVFRSPINAYLGEQLALLLALQVVLKHFEHLFQKTLQGELRVEETALPSLAETVTFVGVGYGLVTAGYGVFGVIYAFILSTIVALVWYLSKLSIAVGRPSLAQARSLFEFFKYSFVTSATSYVFNWTDVLLIGFLLTQADVGIYEIPWRVTSLSLLLSSSLSRVIFPEISSLTGGNTSERIENLVTGGLSVSLYLVVPAFFGVALLARELLKFGFGAQYVAGWSVLVVIAGVRIVEAANGVFVKSLQALNRPAISARSEVVSLTTNVVLNIVLIWFYGILGAAVATLVATGLKAGLNGWYLGRFIELVYPIKRIVGIVLSSMVMVVALIAVGSMLAIDGLPSLVGVVALGSVIYGATTLVVPSLRTMIFQNARNIVA